MAMALWNIERWPFAQRTLIDVLEGRSTSRFDSATVPCGRAEAASALSEFPDDASKAALRRALRDPDDRVRSSAQGSLHHLGEGWIDIEFHPTVDRPGGFKKFGCTVNRSWVLLTVSVLIHFAVMIGCPDFRVPPKLSQQIPRVVWAEIVLVIPFVWSVYVLLSGRNIQERVIGYLSLAGSLFWLGFGMSILGKVF